MKANKPSESQITAIYEYAANGCKSSDVANVFGVSEEEVKDAVDYVDFIRRSEGTTEEEFGELAMELAYQILNQD